MLAGDRMKLGTFFTIAGTLLLGSAPSFAYIGGKATAPSKAPGAVALILFADPVEISEAPELVTTCSGALVAPRWILTAAHCLMDTRLQRLQVVRSANLVIPPLGTELPLPGVNASFKRTLIFPGFKDPAKSKKKGKTISLDNVADVALIELTEPLSGVEPAKLAERPAASGDRLQVGGWGIPAEATDESVRILHGDEDLARLPTHLRQGQRDIESASENSITLLPRESAMRVIFSPEFDKQILGRGLLDEKDVAELKAEIVRSHSFEHISVGDSGGSAYRENGDGSLEIIGVNSLEDDRDGSRVHFERIARVDAESPAGLWIRRTIGSTRRR